MKGPSTFRNKNVIEQKNQDAKNTRPLQSANDNLDKINTNLNTMAGNSDTIPAALKETTDKLDSSVQDVQAGIELVIDSLEPLRDINAALDLSLDLQSEINANISKLSSMLQNKFTQKTDEPTIIEPETSETEESFIKNLPVPVEDHPLKEAISRLFPVNTPEEEKKKDLPKEKDKTDDKDKTLLDHINKGITAGFKSTYDITNRIASMLFKYTVAAAITAAKWAAILLAVVMGIDLIIIHLRYWGKLFNENYSMLEEKLGPLAPVLGSLFKTVNEIKEFWKNGDWGGLAVALIKGVGTIVYNIAEAIEYAIGKLAATILRALGQNDWADKIEAYAIENYAKRTGYMPTAEELELVAKRRYIDKQSEIKSDDTPERAALRARMNVTGETPEQAAEYIKDNNPRGLFTGPMYDEKNIDKEVEAVNSVSKADIARETEVEFKIDQLKRQAQEHKDNPDILDKISDKLQMISNEIVDDDSVPTESKLYDLSEAAAEAALEVRDIYQSAAPEPVEEKEETKSINSISKSQEIPVASNSNTQNNQQINNINTNKTVTNFAPVTNFNAPGMYRAQEVS